MSQKSRKEHRRHIIYYLQLQDTETNELMGRLVDITTIGLMLISENSYQPGKKMAFKIILPPEFDIEHILVSGEIVWCHKDVNPDYFATGLRFDPLSEDTESLVQKLIKKLGFTD